MEIKCIIRVYFRNGTLFFYSSPIPVAARYKALVCCCLLAVIAGSNSPVACMFVVSVVCCQVDVSTSD